MAEYKIIYVNEQNGWQWQPGCPILVSKIQVCRNTETAAAFLQMKVENVSAAPVGKFVLSVEMNDGKGNTVTEQVSCLDADIPAGGSYTVPAKPLSISEVEAAVATVTEVNADTNFAELAPIPLPAALELTEVAQAERLQYLRENSTTPAAITELMVSRKSEDHDTWWLCACGGVNVGGEECLCCHASKAAQAVAETNEELEELAHQRKYKLAEAGLASKDVKQVEQAKALFTELGEYKGASAMAPACDARIAQLTAEKADRNKKIKKIAAIVAPILIILIGIFAFVSHNANVAKANEVYSMLNENVSYSVSADKSKKTDGVRATFKDGTVTVTLTKIKEGTEWYYNKYLKKNSLRTVTTEEKSSKSCDYTVEASGNSITIKLDEDLGYGTTMKLNWDGKAVDNAKASISYGNSTLKWTKY